MESILRKEGAKATRVAVANPIIELASGLAVGSVSGFCLDKYLATAPS